MSPWMFYLVLALAIIALLVMLVLVLRARFAAKKLLADLLALFRRKKTRDFWSGLEQLISDLYTRKSGRYDTPWLMLLGEPASGRSELGRALARGDKTHPLLKLLNRSGSKDAWQILEQGIIIDGHYLGENKQQLKQLLQQINQVRPERPLDGLILTLSAETLLNGSRARLRTQARYIHGVLWLLQKELEFVLPIYVVITKTDSLVGYREFWRQFPQFEQQMFGWSSPYHLEAKFTRHWVATGLDAVVQQLYRLQATALATPGRDSQPLTEARNFILFPRRLANLEENLSWTLEQIFDDVIFAKGASVRGFYFTGKLDETRAPGAVKELIEQKCFAEKNLAKPLRFALWSRSDRLHKTQRFVAYTFGLLFLSLAYSFFDLKAQVLAQNNAMKILAEHSRRHAQDQNECISGKDYLRLLEAIAKIKANISYWNIPYSWLESDISTQPVENIGKDAFGGIIFPAFRCGLEAKAADLAAFENHLAAPVSSALDSRFVKYAQDIVAFETHLSLYQKITTHNSKDESEEILKAFHTLAQYIYQQPLPEKLITDNNALHEGLLKVTYDHEVELAKNFHPTLERNLIDGADILRNSLDRQVGQGESLLASFTHSDTLTRRDIDGLLAWSRDIHAGWIGANEQHNPCAKILAQAKSLVTLLDKSRGYNLETLVQFFNPNNCYQPLKQQLLGLRSPDSRAVLEVTDAGLAWSENYADNLQQLTALTRESFMLEHPLQTASCDQPTKVNHTGVVQALKSLQAYQEFVTSAADPAGEGPKAIATAAPRQPMDAGHFINAAARSHITGLLNYQMANAIQPIGFTLTQEQLVEKVSLSYSQSINELVTLVRLYQQLMLDTADAAWYSCISKVASEQLNEIYNLYLATSIFLPELAEPESQFIYTNMDDAAQVADFLNAEQMAAARLLQYVRPYTRWFNEAARLHKDSSNIRTFFWANSLNEYDKFTRFNDSNSKLGQLRDYYTNNFAGVTAQACNQEPLVQDVGGNDLFSERREIAVKDLASLCADTTAQHVARDYQEVSAAFNRQLAGRYPFANPGAQDLDPQTWIHFSASYGPLITALDQHLTQQEDGDRWFVAKQFIADLKHIGEHLNLLYPKGTPSPVKLGVQFRQNPDSSPGVEQIVQWWVKTPAMESGYPNRPAELEWLSGQALQVSMAWAELSTAKPVRDPGQKAMSVAGKLVSFQQHGPWALHRLLNQQRDGVAKDLSVIPLRFKIPVAEKNPVRDAPISESQPSSLFTEVNPRLTLSLAIKGENAQWQAWEMPVAFPQRAPDI